LRKPTFGHNSHLKIYCHFNEKFISFNKLMSAVTWRDNEGSYDPGDLHLRYSCDLLSVINFSIQLQIRVTGQNSAYRHFEGQGDPGHVTFV